MHCRSLMTIRVIVSYMIIIYYFKYSFGEEGWPLQALSQFLHAGY